MEDLHRKLAIFIFPIVSVRWILCWTAAQWLAALHWEDHWEDVLPWCTLGRFSLEWIRMTSWWFCQHNARKIYIGRTTFQWFSQCRAVGHCAAVWHNVYLNEMTRRLKIPSFQCKSSLTQCLALLIETKLKDRTISLGFPQPSKILFILSVKTK